jgi:hypothetical protein
MASAKRDLSGVFDADLKSARARKSAILDQVQHLSHKGMTFVSDTFIPEWTEVGVEMRMPVTGARRDQSITCRGVVVQSARRQSGKGFDVALVFVDLPKRAQSQLDIPSVAQTNMSISIAR